MICFAFFAKAICLPCGFQKHTQNLQFIQAITSGGFLKEKHHDLQQQYQRPPITRSILE
jgi:hypothetical protein